MSVSEEKREELFITTKLWNSDQGYEKVMAAFDKSLKRLGMQYVDLYLLHWPVSEKRLESWRALVDIYKSGRARAIGVSNFTVQQLTELLASTDQPPMVNQVEFHPFLYQKELAEFCLANNIQLQAYSPLAHGKRLQDPVISEIAAKHAKQAAQVMLRWNLQLGHVILPKSANEDRLQDNLELFDFQLDAEDMTRLSSLNENYRTCWDPTKA